VQDVILQLSRQEAIDLEDLLLSTRGESVPTLTEPLINVLDVLQVRGEHALLRPQRQGDLRRPHGRGAPRWVPRHCRLRGGRPAPRRPE